MKRAGVRGCQSGQSNAAVEEKDEVDLISMRPDKDEAMGHVDTTCKVISLRVGRL